MTFIRTARPLATIKPGRNEWYRIVNATPGVAAEIYIYDEIGYFGVTASDFVRDLLSIDSEAITVHLSTPGGDVFDGIAIYNALRQHKAKITTYVDSLAASIGSVIAMAGDEIVMAPYSTMMIHEASGVAIGANSAEMRSIADLLDKTSATIASIYADRSDGKPDAWRELMKAETWFTAEEAVSAGIADRVDDNGVKTTQKAYAVVGRAVDAPVSPPTAGPVLITALTHDQRPPLTPECSEGSAPESAPPVFDADVFRAAMRFAAEPPVPTDQAPFEFDPEIFRVLISNAAATAPAVAQRSPAETPPTFESVFDSEFFRSVIREVVQ